MVLYRDEVGHIARFGQGMATLPSVLHHNFKIKTSLAA
jgi:hypothetical protein